MDSFLSVRWPLKYRIGDIMTGKRALVVVLITWALSLLISCLPFMMQEMTYEMSRLTFQYILIIKPLPVKKFKFINKNNSIFLVFKHFSFHPVNLKISKSILLGHF